MPPSTTERLSLRLAKTLGELGLDNAWYSFAPGMLGQNYAVDAAARAIVFVKASSHQQTAPNQAAGFALYRSAVESLRTSLDTSDFSLMTTGLLGLYETLRKEHIIALHTHAKGICAIVSARSELGKAITPVMRAAIYENSFMTFQQPIVNGRPSPFDRPEWLELDPAGVRPLSPSIIRLSKLSHQRMLKLPGLVATVRIIRESALPSRSILVSALDVADELLALKDDRAEDVILRKVTFWPDADDDDNPVGVRSFLFESADARDVMLMYWANRLMILKLCLVLGRVRGHSDSFPVLTFDIPKLEAEQERLIMCSLMCWHHGFGRINVFEILWSALMGRERVRTFSAQDIRDWISRKHREQMAGWYTDYSAEDADKDAEILAGGPLKGFIARMIGRASGAVSDDLDGIT